MDSDHSANRIAMVEQQIKRRGINDLALLKALLEVPRHLFVSEEIKKHAYEDRPLPIGYGQTISQPYIVALMIESARVIESSTVLDIGTGSGYAAAVLSRLVRHVYSIERIEELARRAESLFKQLNYKNISVKVGDGTLGWVEAAPFDAILVTAGAPSVPESFLNQLKNEGRVVIPVGDASSQELLRLTKNDSKTVFKTPYGLERIELVRFVPLIGEQGWGSSFD